MSLKQTILVALVKNKDIYGAYQSAEAAMSKFAELMPDTASNLTNPGYFKHFWNKIFREGVLDNPEHELTKTVNQYLAKTNRLTAVAATSTAVVVAERPGIEVKTFNTATMEVNDEMFKTFLTNSAFDDIQSDEGGAMAACSVVVVGGPGVGKSTLMFWAASRYREIHPDANIAVISSEMEVEDLMYEARRKPWMNSLDFILTSEYGQDLRAALEKIFSFGYDIIVLDSFQDIVDKLRDFCGMSGTAAETWLLDLIKRTKGGRNDKRKYTLTFAIQQQTKSGSFAGTNKLKHNTTAMLELRREKNGDRYMVFTKNRRCGVYVGKRLFYFLGQNNHVSFDQERWEREIAENEADNTPINQQQEQIDQQALSQFNELDADSAARAQLLLQQTEIVRDPQTGQPIIPTVTAPAVDAADAEEVTNDPVQEAIESIYFDTNSNLHIYDIPTGGALTANTQEELAVKVREHFNQTQQ